MMLRIQDLELEYLRSEGGSVRALGGVSLELDTDEILGIVGESGCGKSTLAYAIIRTLPPNAVIKRGRVVFRDRDLLALEEVQMQAVRWRKIAMVFQSSMNAFSPVHRIVDQLAAVHMIHFGSSHRRALHDAGNAMIRLGIPSGRVRSYPHEFSGGMRQRAAIALALLLDPELLIADEPTTALDVVVQDRILRAIENWRQEGDRSAIFVSHDISVVSEVCDRVAVLYGGRLMEIADTDVALGKPLHPYTQALLDCIPDVRGRKGVLGTLTGGPPDLAQHHDGCLFQYRCPKVLAECAVIDPPLYTPDGKHHVKCLLYKEELA